MKVTLSLTHKCNLACRYCYAGRTTKPDMSLATAQKSIDTALEALPEGKRLDLCLFGGEPLLRFDLVRDITAYACRQAEATGKRVVISITTNGTLVSPDVLAFAADQRIDLCFSLDGPPDVHDRTRVHRDGRGSYTEVAPRLEQALQHLDLVQVNAVYGPDTLADLPRIVRFFTTFGVNAIHLNPDILATWPAECCEQVRDVYPQVAAHYLECYAHGREVAVNLIDSKVILFVKGGYAISDMCAMGDGEWAVAPSGNIYPCERFIGQDDDSPFCLGNIHTGMDLARRCALRLRRGNHRKECLPCPNRRYCMNWCGCTNFYLSGQTDLPAPILCAMERASIDAARQVFESLVNSGNELFADHLFSYMNVGSHFR